MESELIFAAVLSGAGAAAGTAGIRSYALREKPAVGAAVGLTAYCIFLLISALLYTFAGIEQMQMSADSFVGAGIGVVIGTAVFMGVRKIWTSLSILS